MIEVAGEAYREDGQWKLRIRLPDWVISDVLRDNGAINRTLIMLQSVYPGTTSYQQGGGKFPKVLAMVLFEQENVEPK